MGPKTRMTPRVGTGQHEETVLVEPAGGGPRLWFQLVPEGKRVKNRVHLDLRAADLDAEIERLSGLGAAVRARHAGHVVLTDPEGNEFCLAPAG
ncbi:hypothetical protein EV578_11828 [Streptomyces sp. BK205]|nr:hypothetical protein EV578_11828 [Streptomyces sp. BK205]